MTNEQQFIKSIESYYGNYANDTVRVIIADYLSKFDHIQLKELFDLIIIDYSNTYKMPPDVNRFESAWKKKYDQLGLKKVRDHYEDKHGNVFDESMRKIGHYDDSRFIPFLIEPKIRDKVISAGDAKLSPERYLEYKKDIEGEIKDITVKK